jgi:hypothetical protein
MTIRTATAAVYTKGCQTRASDLGGLSHGAYGIIDVVNDLVADKDIPAGTPHCGDIFAGTRRWRETERT